MARDGCAADGTSATRARATTMRAMPASATTRAPQRRDGRGTGAREGRATRATRTMRRRATATRATTTTTRARRRRDDGRSRIGTGAREGGAARATRARETKTRERDAIEGRERDGEKRDATRLEALDATTETLSFFAMAPLTLLTFPQIWKNYVNVMAGDAAALGAVSWQGYGAGMLGNLLLLSYFADKREPAATAAQAIGVTTSFMLITQIAWTGNIHNVAPAVMFASSAFIIAGTSLSVARYFDYAHGERGQKMWELYQAALGIIGIIATPQIISNALTPALGWLPSELAILALVFAARADALPSKWSEFSGWTATALFMSMPVAQIASNLSNPELLQGLSVLTSVFITSGNALMLSRALFTRDAVWIAGSFWATFVGGWGVLLTLFMARNPLTGERYLSEMEFSTITALLAAYTVVVIGGQLRTQFFDAEDDDGAASSSVEITSR